MKEQLKKIVSNKPLVSILLLAFGMLVFHVNYRTFWMDETAVLEYLHYGPIDFLVSYFKQPDNHPPLYYFLVLIVAKLLSWSEFTVRLVSILSGLGIIGLVYRWANDLYEKKYAYVAAFFTAWSAYFILIAQMARYHSLAALAATAVLYSTYKLVRQGANKRTTISLIVWFAILGWIDYPHFFYTVAITNCYFLWNWFRKKTSLPFKTWLQGQIITGISFLPMLWLIYDRMVRQGDGGFEKANLLSNSFSHLIIGTAFHIYSFFFSENILPWNYAVFIAGALVLIVGFAGIMVGARKKILPAGFWYVAGLVVVLICINTLFLNVFNPRYNFIVYPKYVFAAYPLFILTLVGALRAWPARFQQVLFVVWFGVAAMGLGNFYTVRNYLNGSYFNTFAAMRYVRDHSEDGQYLLITGDANKGVYNFYRQKYFRHLDARERDDWGTLPPRTRAWFFSTGSDAPDETHDTESNIPPGYKLVDRFDSVPLDPTLKVYKEKILHRPSYTYKYSVFLLEKL